MDDPYIAAVHFVARNKTSGGVDLNRISRADGFFVPSSRVYKEFPPSVIAQFEDSGAVLHLGSVCKGNALDLQRVHDKELAQPLPEDLPLMLQVGLDEFRARIAPHAPMPEFKTLLRELGASLVERANVTTCLLDAKKYQEAGRICSNSNALSSG